MATMTVEVTAERFAADTQKAVAILEAGLAKMKEEETPEWFAMLSQGVVKELEALRRQIAERFLPTPEELTQTHEKFLEHEPRDLFYRTAQWLLEQARNGAAPFTPAEALSLLLFVWNEVYYRSRRQRQREDLQRLENELLPKYAQWLEEFRQRKIELLTEEDREKVQEIFAAFAAQLESIGAAKALHLLAPHFFPLWDNEIAKAYGVSRKDAQRYWQFMQVVKWQVKLLREQYGEKLPEFARQNLLKALDEWNYAKFTKKWL